MKVKFLNLIAFNSLLVVSLYIFMFIIYPENSNYFQCNILTTNTSKSFDLTYLIPVSCDLEVYMIGVNDFSSIIEFDYNYQTRPLYILFVKFFHIVLSRFIENTLILEFLTFLILHLFIVTISIYIFFKSFFKKFRKNHASLIYLISGFIILNPIIRYGLFDSAHQTLTLLTFVLCLLFLRKQNLSSTELFSYSILIGLLSLANVSIILSAIFLLYNKVKNINLIKNNFLKIALSIFLITSPKMLWNLYIFSNGFTPYNAATQYWYQFIWLKDFILVNYQNVDYNLNEGAYYCMSVPLFIKCYLLDFFKTIIYLLLPIITIIFNFYILKKKNIQIIFDFLKNLLFIVILLFSFWAFIGWYPPLRFNLYSLGYFVTITLCIQFIYLPYKEKTLPSFIFLFIYYLSLPHWNNLDILNVNVGLIGSYLLFIVYVYKTYKENKTDVSSSL
tara:strand:+ start:24346 stop:25683 length:1338 start_codon:yes stop_codon:yes gene_type:complete